MVGFAIGPGNGYTAPMPVSDLDIHRAAHQWIAKHRDEATAKAREMVEEMRRKGDEDDAAHARVSSASDDAARPIARAGRAPNPRSSR